MRANVAMPLLYNLPVKKIIDAYVILFEIDPHYEYNIYFMVSELGKNSFFFFWLMRTKSSYE